MNIFILHESPGICASYHCDKHVVKMILESAQLLSSAIQISAGREWSTLYKVTHRNHPCALWARESRENFRWLGLLALGLCYEYEHRYGKVHKSKDTILLAISMESKIPTGPFTPFVQCLPEDLKCQDPVLAYRSYYCRDKAYMAKWTSRVAPSWFLPFEVEPSSDAGSRSSSEVPLSASA